MVAEKLFVGIGISKQLEKRVFSYKTFKTGEKAFKFIQRDATGVALDEFLEGMDISVAKSENSVKVETDDKRSWKWFVVEKEVDAKINVLCYSLHNEDIVSFCSFDTVEEASLYLKKDAENTIDEDLCCGVSRDAVRVEIEEDFAEVSSDNGSWYWEILTDDFN